jgi:hypothetical protein
MEGEDSVGHASRSRGLLRLKASRARVSQSGLKTGRGATWMVHMASSWRSHGDKVQDGRVDATGYIGRFYPNFAIFIVLGPEGILVFRLGL